jgi:hypothetical protein
MRGWVRRRPSPARCLLALLQRCGRESACWNQVMPVIDTYAKRKKARDRDGQADVYQYDTAPSFLRKQVALILEASLGRWWEEPLYFAGSTPPNGNHIWLRLAQTMEREVEGFPDRLVGDSRRRCLQFVQVGGSVDHWLTAVEFACRMLDKFAAGGKSGVNAQQFGARQAADDAIDEINLFIPRL